jgi:enamine deaminase RidA (YjgF/YER057c/UK114 family)
MKEFRNPETVHQPVGGGYMHQVEISSSERMLIISGQVGMRQDGTVPEDHMEQLELVFENILRNLQAAGMEMKDLVKLNYFLVGEWDTIKRRELIFTKIGDHPACSTLVYVAGMASPSYKVEVEAWASKVG